MRCVWSLLALLLLVAGCVAKHPYAPPPPQAAVPFVEAQPVEDPPPQKVAAPSTARLLDDLPPDIAAATALYMKSGRAKIVDRRTEGFVVYPYGLTQAKVYCKAFSMCAIELEEGEKITEKGFIIGDPIRWWAGILEHGEGDQRTQTVLVKPNDNIPGLETDIRIGTNRRKYFLRAIYGTKQTINLRFYYPEDTIRKINERQVQNHEQQQDVVASGPGLDVTTLHMNYRVECNGARFCPSWVADDGHKTYILLPRGLEAIGLPALYIEQAGEPSIVNYNTSKLPYYIVERVFDRAVLQMGTTKDAQRVVITREG